MSQDHPHRSRQNPRAGRTSTRHARVRRQTERAAQRSEQRLIAMQSHRARWQRRWARWKQVFPKFVPLHLSWFGVWMSALKGIVRELKGELGSALLRAMPQASVMGEPRLQRRRRKARRDTVAPTALVGEPLEERRMLAATPELLLDIGARDSSSPQIFVEVGSTKFFRANDGINGLELWKTDGTDAGTVMVKDINAGSSGSSPNNLANVGGTLYFMANDGTTGFELWKSDGTAAGTVLVKDIRAGSNTSSPDWLTAVGSTLYFRADDGTNGTELWKSDGTAAGTVMVKDIRAGSGSPNLAYLTDVGGTLYFRANDGTNGDELWKSDGTAAGTVMVKDIRAGGNTSVPGNLTNVGGTLYFRANDGTNGSELWKSNGTAAGTVLVKNILVGGSSSYPEFLTNVGGTLYFQARAASTGTDLWKSDGTAAGTVLVKDIVVTGSTSYPENLTNVGGTLYFTANDGTNGTELWKSNGTAAGTVLVKDIYAGGNSSSPNWMESVGSTLYFRATDAVNGDELWKSDGTAAGTVLVKDIWPGFNGASPVDLTNMGGTLYFRADDGTNGTELWKSNGTAGGTVLVKDINTQTATSSSPSSFTDVNGVAFFVAYGGTTGAELWKSDGTAAGTVLVKDIYAGIYGSYPTLLTNVGGTLYFQADDGTTGDELWKSDGTAAGTVLVKDIYTGVNNSSPANLTNVGGTLYFRANDATNGQELWKSDGTAAGTVLVKDIAAGANGSTPQFLTNVGGMLYFQADDGTNGQELWKSDGTVAGTVLVKDIWAGGNGSTPILLTNVGGTLYFSASDGMNGNELWKSNGTAAGTVMVKDIDGSLTPTNLTNVGGTLYFRATDGTTGSELWKSNGTAAGTVLVKDIYAGGSASPTYLANVGGTLYFQANDGTTGFELWKSDGTAAGTVLVKDIRAGSGSSSPVLLTDVGGTLYFQANDGTNGSELWKSKGTAASTVLVKDISAGSNSSYPGSLTNVGGKLYFRASDGITGNEPWIYLPATPLTGITLDGSSNLVIDDLVGGGKNDKLKISLVGGKIRIEDLNGGLIESSIGTAVSDSIVDVDPLDFSGQIIFNTLSGDDQLTLDFSTGDPIPAGGLTYNGGADIADKLKLIGNGSSSAAYQPSASVVGNGTFLTTPGNFNVTGLDSVDITGMSTAQVHMPFGYAKHLILDGGVDSISGLNPAVVVTGTYNGKSIGTVQLYGNAVAQIATFNGSTPGSDTITVASAIPLGHANGHLRFSSYDGSVIINAPVAASNTILFGSPTVGLNALLTSGLLFSSGSTTTVNVGGSGKIQQAITIANAIAAVNVAAGTYTENVSTAGKAITLAPGSSPGQVVLNGNLTLDANDTLVLEIDGTNAATEYDNFVVTGTVALGGATLSLQADPGYVPAAGDLLTLVSNDAIDAVTGTFATFAQGDVIAVNGTDFRLSYAGADAAGNDVVLLANTAPVADAGGPYTIAEGGSLLLDGSGACDVDTLLGDSLVSYEWDLNGDDVFTDASGLDPTVSWATLVSLGFNDGPSGAFTVALRVTDESGATHTATGTLTITDTVPTLAISGAANVNENEVYTLNLSSNDPGTDTISSWTINWGDGPAEFLLGNPATVTHTYADGANNYVISATATDEDGTHAAGNTVSVTVDNVAPTLVIAGAASVNEDTLYTLTLSETDPGTDTITSWTIDWGDGNIENVPGNPASATHIYVDANNYVISATATDEDGTHAAGNTVAVAVAPVSTMVGRHIFYNQSAWDGNSSAINAVQDNLAIATDKDAYLPGAGTAVFANMTSFTRGVNGIMVDLSAGVTHTGITAADFVFKVGNNNTPSGWAAAPAPSAISVVPGGGVGGSDRVIITWASASIANKWLEVQVLATANTGLLATDVHFWGNKVGDTANFSATTADSAQVFANLGAGKPITDTRDFNRDKSVTTADSVQVFANLGSIVAINIPGGGPFAPEAEPAVAGDGGSSAVASALASPSVATTSSPVSIAYRQGGTELNSGRIADFFHHLAESEKVWRRPGRVARGADLFEVATELDDELLENLVAAR